MKYSHILTISICLVLFCLVGNATGQETKPKTEVQKFQETLVKARAGYAGAQYNLSARYVLGKGVLRDFKEAVKWLRSAADQGHAKAQFKLGVMYENGKGVLKDIKEAGKWWRKAADQGYPK